MDDFIFVNWYIRIDSTRDNAKFPSKTIMSMVAPTAVAEAMTPTGRVSWIPF